MRIRRRHGDAPLIDEQSAGKGPDGEQRSLSQRGESVLAVHDGQAGWPLLLKETLQPGQGRPIGRLLQRQGHGGCRCLRAQ